MGKRTAGAGGYVLGTDFQNTLGIYAMRYTGSVGLRIDNNPIEDLGVRADIHYEPTVNDLQNHYEDYAHAINHAVEGLLSQDDGDSPTDDN